MTILLSYKGWFLTDTGVEHSCLFNKKDRFHLNVRQTDGQGLWEAEVFCTLCGAVMPKETEIHLRNVISFINPFKQ